MDRIGHVFAWVLDAMLPFSGSYGTAVILLTALIQIVGMPAKRNRKLTMERICAAQNEVNGIKKNFQGKPQDLEREINRIYEKHEAGSFSGCFFILFSPFLSILVFLAFYRIFTMPLTYFCGFTPAEADAVMNSARKIPRFLHIGRECEAVSAVFQYPGLVRNPENMGRIRNLYLGFLGINLCEKADFRKISGFLLILALFLLQAGALWKNFRKKTKGKKDWILEGISLPVSALGIHIACQFPAGLLLSVLCAEAADCLEDFLGKRKFGIRMGVEENSGTVEQAAGAEDHGRQKRK